MMTNFGLRELFVLDKIIRKPVGPDLKIPILGHWNSFAGSRELMSSIFHAENRELVPRTQLRSQKCSPKADFTHNHTLPRLAILRMDSLFTHPSIHWWTLGLLPPFCSVNNATLNMGVKYLFKTLFLILLDMDWICWIVWCSCF
jgi:hypothetical protein